MFFGKSRIKTIQSALQQQQVVIDSFITNMKDTPRQRMEWCTVNQRECRSTGLLMWEKDLNHKYTFLNARYCNDFFMTSLADVRDLIGKTDTEALVDFRKRTGLENSFGSVCAYTDVFTIEQNSPCRFWEMGYIGERIMILDITKRPLVQNDVVIGTVSWALNNSNKECEVKKLLEVLVDSGEATRLDVPGNQCAAYLISKLNNPFNGKFPK